MTPHLYNLILAILPLSSLAQQAYKGFPSHHENSDLKTEFMNPPKGYRNVPFYWWEGDTLKKERLLEQLNLLSDVVDGFAVSYIHTHPAIDTEINAQGYGSYGRADGGIPDFYSDEWWNLWNWFSGECGKRDIGVGVDDYVVGWPKNGYYPDEVIDDSFSSYLGRLKMVDADDNNPDNIVYQDSDIIIYAEPSYELHPDYGSRIVEAYFRRFEDKLDEAGRNGMNYFFQDELQYNLQMNSWCEDMTQQFMQRKGYDIVPYLPALFRDMGDITPKIRLDYADVLTQLADERYFKPIFDWHNDRGLIYGCDNNGRGLQPLQYLDYFHAISWFTAPGNDAPARGSSFRQTKVSSSISHLYERPRTWLEAFYSMGWDCNGKWLTSQLDKHIIAGGNLLCMHGLYYSTHGGWWEWAPPCFHFRMPYWPHMKHWLKYAERLCFLLSQGHHVCDIAILYPTETLQAFPETKIDGMWTLADSLSKYGLDYDYIDHTSLSKAEVLDNCLRVGTESYKVLIVPDAKALHYSTLLKIKEFAKTGGKVIFVGELPVATTRIGANDAEITTILQTILAKGGCSVKKTDEAIAAFLATEEVDFKNLNGKATVLHRRIDDRDVYMVMDAEKGDSLFFRCKGNVEIWSAENGKTIQKAVLSQNDKGTTLSFDGDKGQSVLYVFSPGSPAIVECNAEQEKNIIEETVHGDWNIHYIPTMDNKWGDFRLPASDEIIGVEAREMTSFCKAMPDTIISVYGYAPYMQYASLNRDFDFDNISSDSIDWEPYVFSWQYGVFDNPGSQGYHGLKGKVDDRFIILDREGSMAFRTKVYAPERGNYHVVIEGVQPSILQIDGSALSGSIVNLSKGWHNLLIAYCETRNEPNPSYDIKSNYIDNRDRSAVVFYPVGTEMPTQRATTDAIVATKWYGTDHLYYNPYGEENKWCHEFFTAPGAVAMNMKVDGKIDKLTVDGISHKVELLPDGSYACKLNNPSINISKVIVESTNNVASPAQAFFKEPVKIKCEEGRLPLGDWSQYGALKHYSGGIVYNKKITIDSTDASSVVIDLGEVDASCEISINGSAPMIGIYPPFKFDFTDYVKNGENDLQVTVYSSLSNHYQTIPSKYRGIPHSGLFGPVRIIIQK